MARSTATSRLETPGPRSGRPNGPTLWAELRRLPPQPLRLPRLLLPSPTQCTGTPPPFMILPLFALKLNVHLLFADSSTIPAAAAAATSVSASDVKTANLAAHNALRAKYSVRRTLFIIPRICSLTPTHFFSRLLISSGMRRSRQVPKSGLTSATTRTREDRFSTSGTAKTSRLERDRTAPRTSSRYVFNPCWNRTMGQERVAFAVHLECGGPRH